MTSNEILTQMQKIAEDRNQRFDSARKSNRKHGFKLIDLISKLTVDNTVLFLNNII